MNCYNFELNISAYIDGELKQAERESFNQHRDSCNECCNKFTNIYTLIGKMSNFKQIRTSIDFDRKLQEKINQIDNLGPSIWKRLIQYIPFGFEPIPALGFALAITMVFSMSYLLLNQDELPSVDFDRLSVESKENNFEPSIKNLTEQLPAIADSDSSKKQNPNNLKNHIKLVGGSK